ncbi:hypothetical protein RM549_15395 [Salegentibacter sp. F188]|uniref:Uncharacterized protein n=1 Tax=Autumnicola patrickiae TaxID=3075591 RepID=A0ABU3E5C8_9FLAO|nr:hypothetical protein [Salegentibacter sp. F188]MDT0691179.1 hypothetical protein [Salegentibacter sp. F188]
MGKILTPFLPALFIFVFCLPGNCRAQENDLQAGLLNIGVGSVIGGVGALINKSPEDKFGRTFLKGLGQGALGGYLVFESKRLVREFAETGDFGYVWPSKIVNSAGSSIIENAAANRDFWARWHLNIGFNRLEIDTKNNFKFSYRIMPYSLIATATAAVDSRLDVNYSLKTGTFVFRSSEIDRNIDIYGQVRVNTITLLDDYRGVAALPHEVLHTYQYEELSGINSFFIKPMNWLSEKSKIVNLYNRIFFTDFHALLTGALHHYGKSYFEGEAEYYTDTLPRERMIR